jgi:hypothetical protein
MDNICSIHDENEKEMRAHFWLVNLRAGNNLETYLQQMRQ